MYTFFDTEHQISANAPSVYSSLLSLVVGMKGQKVGPQLDNNFVQFSIISKQKEIQEFYAQDI